MVMDNITHILNNFLACSAYDHVIFCWVMHQQAILDEILDRLDLTGVTVVPVSLVCTREVLLRRLNQDVSAGLRQPDILLRSPQRLSLYDALDTIKIDTSCATVPETVQAILRLTKNGI